MMRLPIAIGILLAAFPAGAADLSVRIVDLRSELGEIHVALYDSASRFPKPDGQRQDAVIKAAAGAGAVTAVFRGLPPGTYAAATYHDENGNGHFDQGLLGIPLEGYAFSNDVRPVLAAPDFQSAAVAVPDGGKEIIIRMRY